MNRQNLLTKHAGYAVKCTGSVLSAPAGQQLLIHSLHAYNNSLASCDIGIAKSLDEAAWKLWSIAATTTNVSATIQAASAVSLFGTTNNYGFIAQATKQFSLLTFNISQEATGSPVYAYAYWNGSTWAALTLQETPVYTSPSTQMQIAFNAPSDWALGSGVTGADSDKYSIRALATTAPSQAVEIDTLTLGAWIGFRKSIATAQQLQIVFRTRPLLLDSNEAILPYFSVASANNSVEVAYQNNP